MIAQNETLFDPVHDTQQLYRELLDAFAEPGKVKKAARLTAGEAELKPGSRMLAALALTLLDSEVRFAVDNDDAQQSSAFIRMHTFARAVLPAEADYLFADGRGALPDWTAHVMLGTLLEPEHGATLFLQVDELAEDEGNGHAAHMQMLTLYGPGVPGERKMLAAGLAAEWLEQRRLWNAEYPLGADVVLYTESGKLAALPRTTKVR